MPGPDIGVREVLYAAIGNARDRGVEIRAIEVDPMRWQQLRAEVIDMKREAYVEGWPERIGCGEYVISDAPGVLVLKGDVFVREYTMSDTGKTQPDCLPPERWRRNPNGCGCHTCNPNAGWFVVCDTCGNKRCPHATNHDLACTNSNEPGQKGSAYE